MSPSRANQIGTSGYLSRFQSKVTFGLRLVDAFTGGVPIDTRLQVSCSDILKRPVMKANGDVVFTGIDYLPVYTLQVTSRFYVPTTVTVVMSELDPDYPIQLVSLHASSSYPFHASATLIRGAFEDTNGRRVPSVQLTGRPISDGTQRARLAQAVEPGETWLRLTDMTGRIQAGDSIELRGDRKEDGESRRIISASDENQRTYRISEPLSRAYSRGASVFPVYGSASDHLGEWVMPIRESCPSTFELDIQLIVSGQIQSLAVNGVAGRTTQVACVILP